MVSSFARSARACAMVFTQLWTVNCSATPATVVSGGIALTVLPERYSLVHSKSTSARTGETR